MTVAIVVPPVTPVTPDLIDEARQLARRAGRHFGEAEIAGAIAGRLREMKDAAGHESELSDEEIRRAVKEWIDETAFLLRGIRETKDAQGHEHASDGRFGTQSGQHDSHKAASVGGVLSQASSIIGRIPAAVAEKTKHLYDKAAQIAAKKFDQFSQRYGRKGAVAIMAAVVATFPVPGSLPVTLLAAEGIRAIARKISGAGAAPGIPAPDVALSAHQAPTNSTVASKPVAATFSFDKSLSPAHREQVGKIIGALKSATSLSPAQKAEYATAAQKAIGAMTPAMLARFTAGQSRDVTFHASAVDLAQHLAGKYPQLAASFLKEGERFAGVYERSGIASGKPEAGLHLDGGGTGTGNAAKLTHEVYAHEFAHAIDGKDFALSSSPAWQEAFKAELADGRLTEYGGSKPSEGFAEFGRAVLSPDRFPPAKVKAAFPKCWAVWHGAGLVESMTDDFGNLLESEDGGLHVPEVFGGRIDLDSDGTHADLLANQIRGGGSITEAVSVPDVAAPRRYSVPVEDLLGVTMTQGSAFLADLAKKAVTRLVQLPVHELRFATRLFTDDELHQLAGELGAARMAGDLLGRTLLRDHGQQVRKRKSLREAMHDDGALDVPTVLQSTDYTCGAAALKSVCNYHGLQLTEAQAARLLETTPAGGTAPEALVDLCKEYGLPCEARNRATLDDLAAALQHDAPCICCIQYNGGGHWVVVVGVGAGGVTFMDPIRGRVTEPRDEWERNWWDTGGGKRYDHWALAIAEPRVRESLPAVGRIMEAAIVPESALDFFRALIPVAGVDPLRILPDLRRTAFTLAVSTDLELLKSVQDVIASFIEKGEVFDSPRQIAAILDQAGVSPRNPQYAEAVFRTNTMDAYNQGLQDQLAAEAATFPAWQYSNPHDGRSRPEHAERNGKLYPTTRTFNSVRGTEAKDVINCRCVPIPIDKFELAERLAKGEQLWQY